MILVGGGGHARVLLDSLRLLSVQVLGIVDRDPDAVMKRVLGVPILGPEKVILDHDPSEILLVNGLGGVGDTSSRRRVFQSFSARGYSFAGVVHPKAIISSTVLLSEGIQVMAGAVLNPGTTVGDNSIINTSASVDHDCRIGAHVHIAPGVTLSGTVTVGEGAHVGTAATVIQGVTIGARAIVGAGAVVLRDVASETTVVGNPARVLGARDAEDAP